MARNRLSKLRAMSVQELLSRAAYAVYTAHERTEHRLGWLTSPDRLQQALLPAMARRSDWREALMSSAPSHFFAGTESAEQMRELFERVYVDEGRKARRVASEVARGEIAFFGRRFSFGETIDWHVDPVTGAAWPRVYHGGVPVHGGNVGFGDVKYVWEVNRHQFFVDLAKVAFLDRSSLLADALQSRLRHWMAEVPYATGVPWANALEPAFRSWSWLWSYHLLRAAGLLDAETNLLWLTGFFDHGRFLYRHLERYASPYNHLAGEASALFSLGLLFPHFREGSNWVARGRHVLESTLESQFHPDGGSVEQSLFYHHATLGFYLLAAVLGRRNGVELSQDVWAAIERGIQFSATLMQPDRRLPRIGGADDGKPIRMEHLRFWDFRPYQAIGAVLFSRPDFKHVAGRFWEDALWILGPGAAGAFDHLESRQPATTAALPASGYYVVRSDWSEGADYLCFDCGPQAAGLRRDDVPSAAHGHADCLSVIVTLGGREVLVDPGFFCYNGDPPWEVGFRRTSAHNTVVVDGQDQAQHISKMAWMRTFSAQPEGWSAAEGWVRGSHDGYARLARGVTHRRTAWLRPGYVVIRDELTGGPGHEAQVVFQFAPGRLIVNESWALYAERYELAWLCSVPVRTTRRCGGEDPSMGWVCPSLGVREAAPRLDLLFSTTDAHGVVLTILVDRERAGLAAEHRAVETVEQGPRALCAWVSGGGFVEQVSAALDGTDGSPDQNVGVPLISIERVVGHHGESARHPFDVLV